MNETPSAADPTRRDVLAIDGMFCASCAAGVEAVLGRIPGIKRAAVSFAADAAVIEWNPRETRLSEAIEAISGLGYHARAVDDPSSDRAVADPSKDLKIRLAVAIAFGMWSMLPALGVYLGASTSPSVLRGLALAEVGLAIPVLAYSGWPFYRMAYLTALARVPGMDALISLGVVFSIVLSGASLATGGHRVYTETAVALVTLQLAARLLDARLRRRIGDAVRGLLTLAPSEVTIIDDAGLEERRPLKGLPRGAHILVRPGERLAVDGVVHSGEAGVDRSLLTGETIPASVVPGQPIEAGTLVLDGALIIEVIRGAGGRRIDALVTQIRQLLAAKPAWQGLIEVFARRYIAFAIAGSIIGGLVAFLAGADGFSIGERALAVFVIACPCALSLAAPLPALMAVGAGAKRGIQLRDLATFTNAARPDVVFLDKTGTLTRGYPAVVGTQPSVAVEADYLLRTAAHAEWGSEHPISRALTTAAPSTSRPVQPQRIVPGCGVERPGPAGLVRVGKSSWLAELGVQIPTGDLAAPLTRVYVAIDETYLGAIDLSDELRPGAVQAVRELKAQGVKLCVLSGDAQGPVTRIAAELDIDARYELSPEDKVAVIQGAHQSNEVVAFVGDGLNDGPALAAADLGIAVADATDTAITAAAVVLKTGGVERVPTVLAMADTVRRRIHQNLSLAIAYNLVAVPFAIGGAFKPVIAAIAMALSSIAILANSARPLPGMSSSDSGNEPHLAGNP